MRAGRDTVGALHASGGAASVAPNVGWGFMLLRCVPDWAQH